MAATAAFLVPPAGVAAAPCRRRGGVAVTRRPPVAMAAGRPGGGWASRLVRRNPRDGGGGAGMGDGGGGGGAGGPGHGTGGGGGGGPPRKDATGGGGGAAGAGGTLATALEWYRKQVAASPLETAALTSATAYTLADILSRVASPGGYTIDDVRVTARLFVLGGLVHGPAARWWFAQLDAALPGASPTAVVAKTVADALVFTPCLAAADLLAVSLAGHAPSGVDAYEHLRGGLPARVASHWRVWPVVQAVNFAAVPPPLRVLFVGGAGVVTEVGKALLAR